MGSIVSGLFGRGGSGVAGDAVARARELGAQAVFRPYTVTTGAGTSQYLGDGQYQTALSQPYQDILGTSLAGAGNLFQQAAAFDPSQRAQEVFGEQAALLQPEFQRQATDLQSRLFGSGRLGLRLAGEGAGLGTGSGMVQPDALGLGRAQQQTLAQLAAGARQQAFGEQAQLGQLAGGMLQAGLGVSNLEQQLMAQGLDAETARAASAYASGQLQLDPYKTQAQMQQQQQKSNAGFFGALGGGLLSNPALFKSDMRLKENIQQVGTLANGIKLYNWDWIDSDNTDPTYGVIAQEIATIIPDAVVENADGYLMVNYSHPKLKGVH